jgi:hypothetical protein
MQFNYVILAVPMLISHGRCKNTESIVFILLLLFQYFIVFNSDYTVSAKLLKLCFYIV